MLKVIAPYSTTTEPKLTRCTRTNNYSDA